MSLGVNPMSFTSSNTSLKPADGVPGQFPAGLRILLVDDDLICLKIVEKMLQNCLYEVTKCTRAENALKLLRDNKDGYDIVLSDVHMPDMDGFKLLEHVGLEMDLPVIMMSADDGKDVVMKGVTHGACDYLIKPITMGALKNIWQHVVRRKKPGWKDREFEQSGSEDGERAQRPSEDVDCTSSANEATWKSSTKKRKDEEDEGEDRDDTSTLKKPRVVWSVELHQQFVNAVNQLGIEKAVPKKILELMNVPGLTRENVASHLQKYRLYLRRLSVQQGGLSASFMGNSDGPFGSLTPLHGLELQAFASSGQISPQSLATIQAAAFNRAPNRTSQSLADQRNIFTFENPRIRFMDGQPQTDSTKQPNLLHGIPTYMDSKQLAALQPFGSINMHFTSQSNQNSVLMSQMAQPQLLNEVNSGNVLNLQSSVPSGISSTVLGRSGFGNINFPLYSSVPQSSTLVDFSKRQQTDVPGSSFSHLGSSSRNATLSCKGTTVDDHNSEMKGSRGGFVSNYDALNELRRSRSGDWDQSVGSVLESRQLSNMQLGMDVAAQPSAVVQPSLSSVSKSGVNNHQVPTSVGDSSSSRIKPERLAEINYQNDIDQFEGDDIMSALLKQSQQSESILPIEHEYCFDGFPLDNV